MSRVCLVLLLGFWLAPLSVTAQDMRLSDILIDGQGWELVAEGFAFTEGPAVDLKGNLYFTDVFRGKIFRLNDQGKAEPFVEQSFGTNGLMFGPDGRLYGCQNGKKRIVAYDSTGMDTPIKAPTRVSWSSRLLRRTADRIPSGSPRSTLSTIAVTASSMVAGKDCRRSSKTGWRVERETPMFPWTRFERYRRYCSGSGRSSPHSRRKA